MHYKTYCSDRSGYGVVPPIMSMLSYKAVAVNAQQDPQVPWYLTAETFPSVLQSTARGTPRPDLSFLWGGCVIGKSGMTIGLNPAATKLFNIYFLFLDQSDQ